MQQVPRVLRQRRVRRVELPLRALPCLLAGRHDAAVRPVENEPRDGWVFSFFRFRRVAVAHDALLQVAHPVRVHTQLFITIRELKQVDIVQVLALVRSVLFGEVAPRRRKRIHLFEQPLVDVLHVLRGAVEEVLDHDLAAGGVSLQPRRL